MTGVFTDNQPDFTWLKPFEEKVFKQYFMPYKKLGQVKNATTEAALHLSYDGEQAAVKVYATSPHEHASIRLWAAGRLILDEVAAVSPVSVYEKEVFCAGLKEEQLRLAVYVLSLIHI